MTRSSCDADTLGTFQFQMLNRQKVNTRRYEQAFRTANPELGESHTPVDVTPCLRGRTASPDANERGWKDTFRMNPDEVTRVLVRWAPQDASPAFAFDATAEPGYVWPCHILEHEENDMMRPFHLVAPAPQPAASRVAPKASKRLQVLTSNLGRSGGTLRFSLPAAGHASLDLFAVTGQRITRLADGWFEAGEQVVSWDGRDATGTPVGTGIYFVSVRANGITLTRKLLVAR